MSRHPTVSKISVSVPADLMSFLERYQQEHGVSRSEAVAKGLEKLREDELAASYRDHAKEWKRDPDRVFWDTAAVDDGLDGNEPDG